jgi:DNA-directed RNA polymerase specialized sigma24 family protein
MVTYEDLVREIDLVAKVVAKDYPDISWEDLRQDLAVFVIQNGKSIKPRSEGGNPKKILQLVANQKAKGYRTEHMVLSPQYAYRPDDIKNILETAFFTPDRSSFVPDDARNPLSKTFNLYDPDGAFQVEAVDPFHFADAMEVASDVKAALKKLKPELREAIFRRYALGEVPDNASWQRKRLNNAINELTRKLNWYRGFDPDRRKSTSNAGARARISEDYE